MSKQSFTLKRMFLWALLIAAGSSVIPLAMRGAIWAQAIILAAVFAVGSLLGIAMVYWIYRGIGSVAVQAKSRSGDKK